MTVYLAMYKGPGSKLRYKVFHYGTCIWTLSRYSHCEMIIDGIAYSSSARDGGTRFKNIPDLNDSTRWDLFELPFVNPHEALKVFETRKGRKYDYLGVARYVLPFMPNSKNRDYCSEIVSLMAGLTNTEKTPEDVFRTLVVDRYRQSIPMENQHEENPF